MNEELKEQITALLKIHTPEEVLQILTDDGHILTLEEVTLQGIKQGKKMPNGRILISGGDVEYYEHPMIKEQPKQAQAKKQVSIEDVLTNDKGGTYEAEVTSNGLKVTEVSIDDIGDVDEVEAALLEAHEQIERTITKIEKLRDLKFSRGKDCSRYLTSLRELKSIKNRIAG